MEVIKNNLQKLDVIGLRHDKLKDKSYDDIQKILINQEIYDKVNMFINSLKECKVEGKLFLTAFAMKYHMSCMVDNINTKENHNIYQLITITLDEYESLFTNELTEDIINSFSKRLNIFNEKFIEWKKQDLYKVIEKYTKMFWSLENQKKNGNMTNKQKQGFTYQQNKIKDIINKIGGKEGMAQFNQYTPLMFDPSFVSKLKEQVKKTYKIAYWDKLKEDLDNKNYDSTLLILEEIRTRIALMVPKRIDIHQLLAEYIDIKFIKQMIDNNAIDNAYIYRLVQYIIDKIKEMGAPADNTNTEEWRDEIDKLFESDIKYSEFFPIFFQKTFNKIEKIEKEIKIVKESDAYKDLIKYK